MRINKDYEVWGKDKIIDHVVSTTNNNEYLTSRSRSEVKKWVDDNSLYLLTDNQAIIGFVAVVHVYEDLYEINSVWVDPKFRGKSYGIELLKKATSLRSKYVAATFYKKNTKTFLKAGFSEIKLFELKQSYLFHYLRKRKISSIMKGLMKNSYLFFKEI